MNRTLLSSAIKNNIEIILIFFIITAYIAFASQLPISIFTSNKVDDGYFISSAISILNGQWLGTYNNVTLIKGITYTYFLIVNKLLGLSITASIAMLYAGSCLTFTTALRRIGLGKNIAILLFIILLLEPALLPTRIIRDNIYHSLTLLTASGVIYLVFDTNIKIITLAAFGICSGLFWMTREEGIWVIPSLLGLIGYGLLQKDNQHEKIKYFSNIAIFLTFSLIPLATTATINHLLYGRFQRVDFKSGEFVSALNALNSVDDATNTRHIPVSIEKRHKIYNVSPAFKELEPFLENKNNVWIQSSCAIYPEICGDYAGGWFIWALRDATQAAGYYSDPNKAANYYRRLAEEINLSCSHGKLKCKRTIIPFMPIIQKEELRLIPEKILEAINLTLYSADVPLNEGPSWGPIDQLEMTRAFLGQPKSTPAKAEYGAILTGWLYNKTGTWLHTECLINDRPNTEAVDHLPSQDIATHFNDKNAQHSRLTLNFGSLSNCMLIFDDDQSNPIPAEILLSNLNRPIKIKDSIFYLDSASTTTNEEKDNRYTLFKEILGKTYRYLSLTIFPMGVLCFLYRCFHAIARKSIDKLFIVAIALWVLYLSRIALLVLIDITSFPAIFYMYLQPALPILMAACLLSISSFIKAKNQLIVNHN